MKLFVSGLINVETNLRVRSFPVTYYPIDYPFFGISSSISGVGYNISVAARTLGDGVEFCSLIGNDHEGDRIAGELDNGGFDRKYVFRSIDATPVSVVLYEPGDNGRRQIYCDLKDIQDKTVDADRLRPAIEGCDLCVLCNSNFNRVLLPVAKAAGKPIATDVHAVSDPRDPFNRDFMNSADILFLSDENLPVLPKEFILTLKKEYPAHIIVIGLGAEGALLYERATDKVTAIPAVRIGGVVNTVGAGDALFTAFNHYYLHGCDAVEALKKAAVFAALKIRHDGGAKGFASEEEVEKIYSSYRFV